MTGKNRGRVLVIRRSDIFSDILKDQGYDVVNLPLIKTEPLDASEEFTAALKRLNEYDGIFFTSPVAAEIVLEEAGRIKVDLSVKIYVLGDRCRSIFENGGVSVISRDVNTIEQFLDSFDENEFADGRFLYFRGTLSTGVITEKHRDKAEVDEITVYRTVEESPDAKTTEDVKNRLNEGKFDWICFFSPSAVHSFVHTFSVDAAVLLKAAAIGETTAKAAEQAGFDVKMTARKASAESFAMELLEHLV